MKLTKAIIQKYNIEIDSLVLDYVSLPKPITLYYIDSDQLKVHWSGKGNKWLQKAKRDLLAVIFSE